MRVLSVDGGGLVDVPQALRDHALRLTRQEALRIDDAGRPVILAECAAECEVYIGRLVIPVAGGRTVVTIAQLDTEPIDPIAILPRWPDLSGLALTDSSVERWESGAWVSAPRHLRAGGRVVLEDFRAGDYRLAATATPAVVMPTAFIEATARLYAARTTARPVDNTEGGTGATFNLSGMLLRSGAAEVLRQLRRIY